MKRRRHTPEQIIRKLREADRLLTEGREVPEVAKQLEVSEATYHRWRAQYGGFKADDVKRLKEPEAENARLKRIVADKEQVGRHADPNGWAGRAGFRFAPCVYPSAGLLDNEPDPDIGRPGSREGEPCGNSR